MTKASITRRELIKAGALAVSGAAATTVRANESQQKPTKGPMIGMATTDFRTHTNAQLARELAAEGVQVVQLFLTQTDSNYWKYNGRS